MLNSSMKMMTSNSHSDSKNSSLQMLVSKKSNTNTTNNDGNYDTFDFGIEVSQLVEEPEFTDDAENATAEAESAHVGTYPGSFVKYMDAATPDSHPAIPKSNSSMASVLQDSSWVFHLSDIFKNLSFNAKEGDASSAQVPHDGKKKIRSVNSNSSTTSIRSTASIRSPSSIRSTNEADFAQSSSAPKPRYEDIGNTSLKDVFMDVYSSMNPEAMKPRPIKEGSFANGALMQPTWDGAEAYQQSHHQQQLQEEQLRHSKHLTSAENSVPLLQPGDLTKTRQKKSTQRSTPMRPADSTETYAAVPQLADAHAHYTLEQMQQEQLHQQHLWQERQRHADLFAGSSSQSVPDEQTIPNLHPSCTGSQYPLKRRLKKSFNVMSTPQRKKASIWSKEEDERLRQAVKIFGSSNWKAIETHVGTRSNQSCAQRWRKKLDPKIYGAKKGTWTTEEDQDLQRLVQTHGTKGVRAWKAIEAGMNFRRTRKQCRERWTNFLDPNLNRGPWTDEEDRKLLYLASTGKNWKSIMKEMPGRTQTRLRRRLDKIKKSI